MSTTIKTKTTTPKTLYLRRRIYFFRDSILTALLALLAVFLPASSIPVLSGAEISSSLNSVDSIHRLSLVAPFPHDAATPRCGVDDAADSAVESPRVLVAVPGGVPSGVPGKDRLWTTPRLTYRVASYPPRLPSQLVDAAFRRAFAIWSSATPFRFVRMEGLAPDQADADIVLSFSSGFHGDAWAFDGPLGVLAHAFRPHDFYASTSGDVHFDADENWTVDADEGIDLTQLAAHEIGHSLGFKHVPDERDSVMWPYAKKFDPLFSLSQRDRDRVRKLYPSFYVDDGSGGGAATPPSPPPQRFDVETTKGVGWWATTKGGWKNNKGTTKGSAAHPRWHVTPESPFNVITTKTSASKTSPRSWGYTARTNQFTTGSPSPSASTKPSVDSLQIDFFCKMDYDALDVGVDGFIYGFKDGAVAAMTPDGAASATPQAAWRLFPYVPSRVDATTTAFWGITYIFSGGYVQRYRRYPSGPFYGVMAFMDPAPLPIQALGLPDDVKKIDAAFPAFNEAIVFVAGNRWFEYDGVTSLPLDFARRCAGAGPNCVWPSFAFTFVQAAMKWEGVNYLVGEDKRWYVVEENGKMRASKLCLK